MVEELETEIVAEEEQEYKPDPATEAFVTEWFSRIDKAKAHHKKSFDRMIEDQALAAGRQWSSNPDDDRYVVNIIGQVLRQRVASLYAKNPTVTAKRRPRLDFRIWDGKMQSLQAAMQNPMDPMNMMLLTDVQQGKAQRQKIDGVARTLEVAVRQHIQQVFPRFKRQMKIMVRRAETCGLGYLKLDFQRQMEARPDIEAQIADCTSQLSHLEMLLAQEERDDFDENSAKAEELRASIETLQQKKYILVREGVVYSFPRATSIIIDPACTQLEGFLGANWIAEEFYLPKDEIERVYGIDVGKATGLKNTDQEVETVSSNDALEKRRKDKLTVYEIYDKATGSSFTLLRGYCGYLKSPKAPNVMLERFFPYFALAFNELEDETGIFPPSTVRLLKHVQLERNRSKEALRQHRIAKQPTYGGVASAVSQEDKDKLGHAPAHHVAWFESLQPGQKGEDLFWEIKKAPIDPNVYETGSLTDDVTIAVGMADAHIGAVSGATATESSIAEDSRASSLSSNVDDLDDFLSEVFAEVGYIYLLEMSAETISKAVGPGAVWPEFSADEVISDVYLEIEAGSSGRPNKALQASTFERIFPLLIQLPGVSPEFLARKLIKILDDNVDLADAYVDGMPSVQAINMAMGAMAKGGAAGMEGATPTGNAMTDPNMQGMMGSNPIPQPPTPSNMGTVSQGLMEPT